jgi:hypothetical protein
LKPIATRRNQTQISDAHKAELAGESQRLIATLLLGESRNRVLAGVVDTDLSALLDSKSAPARKTGVQHIILGAGGGGTSQFRRPPCAGGAGSRHEQTDSLAAILALRLNTPSFDLT